MTTEHNIVSFVLLFDCDFSLFERACFFFFFFSYFPLFCIKQQRRDGYLSFSLPFDPALYVMKTGEPRG